MKQLLIFLSAFIVISCNDAKPSAKFVLHTDTSRIQAAYIDFSDSLSIKNGIVFELISNRIKVDSLLKTEIVKDSIFYYKPSKDTTDKWSVIRRPFISTERNVDSAVNQLLNIVKQIKQQDTLKKFTGIIVGKDSFGAKQ